MSGGSRDMPGGMSCLSWDRRSPTLRGRSPRSCAAPLVGIALLVEGATLPLIAAAFPLFGSAPPPLRNSVPRLGADAPVDRSCNFRDQEADSGLVNS